MQNLVANHVIIKEILSPTVTKIAGDMKLDFSILVYFHKSHIRLHSSSCE